MSILVIFLALSNLFSEIFLNYQRSADFAVVSLTTNRNRSRKCLLTPCYIRHNVQQITHGPSMKYYCISVVVY